MRDQRDVDTCNLTTRRLTRIARLPATANVASDEAPFVATSDGRTVRALPNPSGTRAILADDSAAALGGARLRLLHPESYAATLRLTEAPNGTTVTPADLSTCTRSVWLDDRTLICRGSRGDSAQSQFQHLRQRNPRQRVNPRPLLPANDRDNYNPVLAPDGTELAFLSKRGTINTLYRTATIAWDRSPGVTRRTRGKRMTGRAARWARDMLAVLGASGPLRVDELPAAVCGCRLLSPLETEAAVDALVCVLARPDVALAGDVLELRTTLAA